MLVAANAIDALIAERDNLFEEVASSRTKKDRYYLRKSHRDQHEGIEALKADNAKLVERVSVLTDEVERLERQVVWMLPPPEGDPDYAQGPNVCQLAEPVDAEHLIYLTKRVSVLERALDHILSTNDDGDPLSYESILYTAREARAGRWK